MDFQLPPDWTGPGYTIRPDHYHIITQALKHSVWTAIEVAYKYKYFILAALLYKRYAMGPIPYRLKQRSAAAWLYKRFGGKTRFYKGKKAKANRLAKVSDVKRMISIDKENKYLVTAATQISSILDSSNPVLYLLNGLTQGDTDSTRDGDTVTYKRMRMRLIIATSGSCVAHVQVIRVKKPRGVAPTLSNMFGSSTPNPITYPSNSDQTFNQHYEIVYDSERSLTSNYSAQVVQTLYDMDLGSDLKVDYSLGNAGTIADIDTNALYLVIRTDASNQGWVTLSKEFVFKDN